MSIIQIFIITFAVFVLTRTVVQFRKGSLTLAWLIFWVLFWMGAGTIAVLPQTTDVVAQFVGVGRGADFIIYVSIITLFFLLFRLFIKIECVEQEITQLVRKLSIEDSQEDDKNKPHAS